MGRSENALSWAATPELELLVQCARAAVEPSRVEPIRQLVTKDLNWDRVIKLAVRNGLSPLLCFHLNQICAANVPAAAMSFLHDHFHKNSAFSVVLTSELTSLLRTFNENGIRAVPYKGPAIAARLYGNLSLRQCGDLDILVREADVWKASELITARGFQSHFSIPETKRNDFVRLSYVQLFRRDAGQTMVELHWGIAPRFFGVRFDAESYWQRLESMTLQGTTIAMPSAEDLLLTLCVHGAKDCWEKLEWVGAIAELMRSPREIDWESVWQRASEMRCRRMVALGLLLVYGLFEIPIPAPAQQTCESKRLWSQAREVVRDFALDESPTQTFLQRVGFHLRLKDNLRDQTTHCARLAFTTTPVDWATMPLPSSLSFVSPVWRAIRLTRKYGIDR